MRLAIVSTYAPKACGIAVFSGDLRTAMLAANRGCRVDVVAMLDERLRSRPGRRFSPPSPATSRASYRAAAEVLADDGRGRGGARARVRAVRGTGGRGRARIGGGPPPAPGGHPAHRALRTLAGAVVGAAQALRPRHADHGVHPDRTADDRRSGHRARRAGTGHPARSAGPPAVEPARRGVPRTGPYCRPSASSRPARASRPPSPPCPRSWPCILRCCISSWARRIPDVVRHDGESYRDGPARGSWRNSSWLTTSSSSTASPISPRSRACWPGPRST